MSWDAFQREALAELGLPLHRHVDDEAPVVPDDPLTLALLKAAGRTPESPDAASLCREWGAPARVRDPVAKRALWPRLRALRKQG